MLFGSRQRLSDVPTFTVSIDGFRIKHVTRYTYLGVVLEQTLYWNEHVTHLISKAEKTVGVLGRIRQNITTNTANTVYKTSILPVLEYCDTAWTHCGNVNASSSEKLQRRAARIIVKSSNSELWLLTHLQTGVANTS